jgi:hypothetical protein
MKQLITIKSRLIKQIPKSAACENWLIIIVMQQLITIKSRLIKQIPKSTNPSSFLLSSPFPLSILIVILGN